MFSPNPQDSSLTTWLQEHRGIFVKVARAFARDAVEIAELQHEMVFQVWQSLRRFEEQSKPSTWIYRVCLNTALTWKRGSDRRERHLAPDADINGIAATARTPAETVEQREWLDRLYDALQTLTVADRALVLLMLDGLSYREIADVTGMTDNHVGVALTRARKRLTAQMKGVIDELG
jgi:RNA polymerase sigma-70 factor, ECF subfamily